MTLSIPGYVAADMTNDTGHLARELSITTGNLPFDPASGGPVKPLLAVRDLRVATARGISVIDGINFEVRSGETLAIVGESGAGKSLTALAIMRLLPSHFATIVSGSIELDGVDLVRLSEPAMRRLRGTRVGMIFQDPLTALSPVMTAGSQIIEVLRSHTSMSRKEARAATLNLLERVHIPAASTRIDEYPHRLSGGMRQRVMIAMALACNPQLLIADEPTTALDVTIQAQILDLLSELKRDLGIGLVLITHDLDVVRRVANRVAVMYAGRIVEQGQVTQVLAQPAHPYTAGLLAARPHGSYAVSRHQLHEIPGTVPAPDARPEGCTFRSRCPKADDLCATRTPHLEGVSYQRDAACHHPLTEDIASAVPSR